MATQFANGKIVTNGLVLALDAADRNSYVSGSLIWNDVSGNGYNGVLTNGPTFDSANGGSVVFDGVNDYCVSQYSGSVTDSFTFSAWGQNPTSQPAVLLCRGRDGRGDGFSAAIGLQNNFVVSSTVVVNGTQVDATSSQTGLWKPNEWCYVTGVWQSGVSISVYFNGVLLKTTLSANTNLRSSTDGWVLASITTGVFYNVKIANASIYNRVLSTQEILQNYNAQKSRFGLK